MLMLDERQMLALDKLVEGTHTRSAIARDLNISRQTLYNYLENAEFAAELDKRMKEAKGLVEKRLNTKMDFALDNILKIAADSSNQRTMLEANKYILDRCLGKPTSKVDLEAGLKPVAIAEVDLLEAEFAEFDEE